MTTRFRMQAAEARSWWAERREARRAQLDRLVEQKVQELRPLAALREYVHQQLGLGGELRQLAGGVWGIAYRGAEHPWARFDASWGEPLDRWVRATCSRWRDEIRRDLVRHPFPRIEQPEYWDQLERLGLLPKPRV